MGPEGPSTYKKNENFISETEMELLTRFWNCNRINEDLRAFWVNRILLLSNGAYFHPPMHFQEVFGRDGPSTLKIEENELHFFSILGRDESQRKN